jgi:CheY-like chemotaxis protein
MVRSRRRIAVVDDDPSVCKALARLLRTSDLDADAYGSAEQFLASLQTSVPDCLVLDLQMPVMDGLALQRTLGRSGRRLPIVVITGHDEPGMHARCLAAGASAYPQAARGGDAAGGDRGGDRRLVLIRNAAPAASRHRAAWIADDIGPRPNCGRPREAVPSSQQNLGGDQMRIGIVQAVLMLGVAALIAPAAAQSPAQDTQAVMQSELGQQVLNGCNAELVEHCAEVTPGEGRLLACLFAYGDQLSGQCELALYDAAARLERAINTISYVASECRSELQAHCANVQPGEGRIAQCLADNASELSPGCDQALTTVGVK